MEHSTVAHRPSASAPTPVRGGLLARGRAFWIVAYALAATILGNNIPAPLYPIYQARWHFSTGVLTLVFAVVAVGVVPSLLVLGPLSDRVGRRPILLLGLALAAAAAVVFVLAQGVAWLAAARVLQGLAFGAFAGTAAATLAELQDRDADGGRAPLVATIATVASQAAAPLLAGVLAQYAPWPTTLVYLVLLALLAPALLGVWAIPETVAATTGRGGPALRFGVPAAIRRPFALAAVAVCAAFGVLGLISALGPSLVGSLLHVQNRAVGGLEVFALLGTSAAAQLVARRWPLRRMLTLGPTLLAVGLAVLVLALPPRSLALFIAGTVCAGLGQGLTYLGSQRLVTGVAPADERAEVLSAFNVVVYLAASAAALGVGVGAGLVGFYQAIAAIAAVIGALALGAAVIGARTPLLAPPPAPPAHLSQTKGDAR